MARDHARILLSIWDNPEFLRLTSAQQITYVALLSSNDLSWCGVAPLLPQRLSNLASDLTERKSRSCIEALAAARFLLVDEQTAEVAIRSYVRHDGILKQPNVTKGMVRALGKVHSDAISSGIVAELGRHFQDEPDAKGWKAIEEGHPELFAQISTNPRANPSRNPSVNPLRKAS